MNRKAIRLGLMISFLAIIRFAYAQNRLPTNQFEYTDCSCSVKIDLTIHNGLSGSYGGQPISNFYEKKWGAVTVANLNDTDGDTIIDNLDSNVIAGSNGRDEVDLMKLEITSQGAYVASCPNVELVLQGPIQLWKNRTKGAIQNNIIPILSLPLTIWVEATQVSASVRDIKIEAVVDGKVKDVVSATSIWVDKLNVYTPNGARQMNPSPNTLGIDNSSLLTIVNYFGEAADQSRYGFGEFDPNDTYFPPPDNKPRFGSRVLFEYQLLPNGIESHLSNLGINYDITRRKKSNFEYVTYNNSMGVTTKMTPFPNDVEGTNDDTSQDDEDCIPISREIFSYDAPSELTDGVTNVLVKRRWDFEEFVRVSFGSPVSGNSNTGIGSRCSNHYNWNQEYGLRNISTNPSDPYDPFYHKLDQTSGGTIMQSLPRRVFGSGNGQINIIPQGNIQFGSYSIQFNANADTWYLTDRVTQQIIATSNTSSTGPWNFPNSAPLLINITQGPITFTPQALFLFQVWDMPPVTNSFNAN